MKQVFYVSIFLILASLAETQIFNSRFSSQDIYKYDEMTVIRIGEVAFIPAQSGLINPHGIIDRGTDILVASWTHEIKRYDRDTGQFLGNVVESDAGRSNPVYLEVGPDGFLYVSSQLNGDVLLRNESNDSEQSIEPVDSGNSWAISESIEVVSGSDRFLRIRRRTKTTGL